MNNIPFFRMMKHAHKAGQRAEGREMSRKYPSIFGSYEAYIKGVNSVLEPHGYTLNFPTHGLPWGLMTKMCRCRLCGDEYEFDHVLKGTALYRMGRAAIKKGNLLDLNQMYYEACKSVLNLHLRVT